MDDILQVISELGADRRGAALQNAKRRIRVLLGDAPRRADFQKQTVNEYPAWMQTLVILLFALLLLFAFIPSGMRLYAIGSATSSVQDANSKNWVGASSVVIAEIGTLVFILTLAVIGKSVSKTVRRLLLLSAIASTAFAIVGNVANANPGASGTVFAWMEALLPSLLTLSSSYALKELMLNIVAGHHFANAEYKRARMEYEYQLANAEHHPAWQAAYANALLEQMQKATRSQTVKARLKAATPDEKLLLFQRELRADSWFANAQPGQEQNADASMEQIRSLQAELQHAKRALQEQEQVASEAIGGMQRLLQEAKATAQIVRIAAPAPVAKARRNGNSGGQATGELQNAITEQADGTFLATCPRCNAQIAKDNGLSAARALSAHMKAHKGN